MENPVTIIAEGPEILGGSQAYDSSPLNYNGPCRVVSGNGQFIAAFPEREDAQRCARYMITPDGGCSSATVEPCSESEVTHQSFNDWF